MTIKIIKFYENKNIKIREHCARTVLFDNYRNKCESLACYGGESGQCYVQKIYRWAYNGVICNGKAAINDQEEVIVWNEFSHFMK